VPRLTLLASVGLWWANYLLTARWANVAGSIHGAKEPWFLVALTLTTALAVAGPVGAPVRARYAAAAFGAAGMAFLAWAFFVWFPASTWSQIPFLDNWPARYQSTLDQIALMRRGSLVGWQWAFLGGYHLSSDLTVSLGVLASLPVALFGDRVGFHLLHLVMFAALPLLVWLDLVDEENPDLKWLAAGLTAVLATNYSFFLLRSGDTNSLAGVLTTTMAVVAAHAMQRHRWARPLLVAALSLITYAHAGFLLFAALFLALDVALARDPRHAARVALAFTAALVVGLPLTWESWRYPQFVTLNNAVLNEPAMNWASFLRKVYYNTELLVRPGRWFNDYAGLAAVLLPMSILVAIRAKGRARFHACATILTVALVRLYDPVHLGFGLLRAIHMHVVFLAPVLAWFIASCSGGRALAVSLVATVALYIQMMLVAIPHVTTVRDFDEALVDRLATLDGALVLLENSYHRQMDNDRANLAESTPFQAHFEALLPSATGRRFYAGVWDGWQWAPARRNLLANGALGGRRLNRLPDAALLTELRRWGIRDLMVWSRLTTEKLSGNAAFSLRWQRGRWSHFELRDADIRSVETSRGQGTLHAMDPLSARIDLTGVVAGDTVVVRTNYYPAWTLRSRGMDLPFYERGGQIAFAAPRTGTYAIEMRYPTYRWTLVVAAIALVGGSWVLYRRT
jgi:hypothetical protein